MGRSMARAVRFRPQRVLRAADQLLDSQRVRSRPRWHSPLQQVPPAQILLRPVQHHHDHHATVPEEQFLVPGQRIRNGRPLRSPSDDATPILNALAAGGLAGHVDSVKRGRKGTYKPKNIAYAEDELRDEFFGDHPWELARPRIVLETPDRHAAEAFDWSTGIEQPGKQLNGESVVQRQRWLMQHEPFPSQAAAYDQARKEFYKVRRRQEVETRVAAEEARAVGAIFGPSMLEVGMKLEDEVWDRWRELAGEAIDLRQSRQSSQALSLGIDSDAETERLQNDAQSDTEEVDAVAQIPEVEEQLAAEIRGGISSDYDGPTAAIPAGANTPQLQGSTRG